MQASPSKKGLTAFQGHIYATFQGTNPNEYRGDCPLADFARLNPYAFEDETQIVFLACSYVDPDYNKQCLWRFAIPENYMFKMVFHSIGSDTNATIEITNALGQRLFNTTYAFTISI